MRISVFACLALTCFALVGCGPPPKIIKMNSQPGQVIASVTDATAKDSYPAFAIGEGNIYSCRCGIHHYDKSEFVPPKAQMFGEMLTKANPAAKEHAIVLEQFDVYLNWRLRLLSGAGKSQGGGLGMAVAGYADAQNNPTATLPPFTIQENPGNGRSDPNQNEIGCDGAGEGEYYPSQINGGSDVIVTWLKFSVDGKPYSYRSTYGFHFDAPGASEEAARKAIQLTIEAAAQRI